MGCGKKQMHAKSEAQQHLMGAALSAKRGGKSFPAAKAVASEMSESQLERFASKGGRKKK
jgi:hypothetical protein